MVCMFVFNMMVLFIEMVVGDGGIDGGVDVDVMFSVV